MTTSNASNGVQSSSVLTIAAGPSGIGKTTDLILTWPRALFFCSPGAVKPARQFLGRNLEPWQIVHVRTINDVLLHLQTLTTDGTLQQASAVVVDDLSILAESSYLDLKAQYNASRTFAMWDDLKRQLQSLREWLRHLNLHASCNAHLAVPETDSNGVFHKGGPSMPSKKMRAQVPHIADLVLVAEAKADRKPWGAVYRCDPPNPQWHVKDRHGVCSGIMPLNTGEILRAAGYAVPRLPGLEWQDAAADKIAQRLKEGQDPTTVWSESWEKLASQGVFNGHVYMALRDGMDRHAIQTKQQNGLKSLFTSGKSASIGGLNVKHS